MSKEREDPIHSHSEREASEYLRRSSITYLECAVHLMSSHMSASEVAEILRAEADLVEEFDE